MVIFPAVVKLRVLPETVAEPAVTSNLTGRPEVAVADKAQEPEENS